MEETIGALWEKTSKTKGDKFLSGVITINGVAHEIVLFANQYKKEPKHPDWRIFPSKPKPAADVAPF